MATVSIRELNTGIYQALILIIIYFLSAGLMLTENFPDSSTGRIILLVVSFYFYISLLLLVRRIMLTDRKVTGFFFWIVVLEAIRFISRIMMIFDTAHFFYINLLFGVILLILYFSLMIIFMSKEKDHILKVVAIRPTALSVIIVFIVNLSLQTLHALEYFLEMMWLLPLFRAMPFILLAAYLKRLKRTKLLNIQNTGSSMQEFVNQKI